MRSDRFILLFWGSTEIVLDDLQFLLIFLVKGLLSRTSFHSGLFWLLSF